MKKIHLNFRSAYGQLILIVFLPIVILALVGGFMVFKEVHEAVLSEQDAQAQSALVYYEFNLKNTSTKKGFDQEFYKFAPAEHVLRMMLMDTAGNVVAHRGSQDVGVPAFDKNTKKFSRLVTDNGMAYGKQISIHGTSYWLVVEMDGEPLIITHYRVAIALVITGLTTLLLLLLILNIYSKRWIAPIYEMRLFLQRLNANNLSTPIKIQTDGEFSLLQRDFGQAMRRLHGSFEELKNHAEETETDLQQALDEMEMQTISIRKARDMAVSSSQAKSAFLANISHELRTPLNSIDGFISLLARHKGLNGEQSLYVQTIKKSSAHLLALVNDVLDFSKMEAGKLELDGHEFDLYATIYDVVDMLSPTALEKHLRLSVMFYNDVPSLVFGDSLRVKQILTNLVGNAIKFTDTGGVVVTVRLSQDHDDVLKISVEDTGKGVSVADEQQLFKSFSQGDLSITRRYGGTGLGLVISKQLTQMMGGSIGFFDNNRENVAKTGATFWFEMPVVLGEIGHAKNREISTMMDGIPTTWTHDRLQNILVWINHAPTILAMKSMLAGTNTAVHFAIGFADVLEQLDDPSHGFDWVIVDYFGQDASLDDVGAVLRQIRARYDGKLSAYGYQVGMDSTLLQECNTHALYEPMDRRQLYAMLDNQQIISEVRQLKFTGKRILAVDDHLPNLMVLGALLEEFDVTMMQASSGFDAVEMVTKSIGTDEAFDLIFMDIQMPRMSGLEASIQIRKIEEAHHKPPTPIIALTAHGLSDEKERLVAAGLNDYVGKPIGLERLMQVLQHWLGDDESSDLRELGHGKFSTNLYDAPQMTTNKHLTNKNTLPDIDRQDMLERSANKEDLAQTLLTMLVESSASEKLSLERAWADRDRSTLADVAHRLVGASRYTGVPRLRAAAESFEQKCRENLEDTSAGQFVSIRPSYRELIDALEILENIDVVEYFSKDDEE